MRTWMFKVAYFLIRVVFWLRYRIRYIGLDKIEKELKKSSLEQGEFHSGILFLPNHPAVVIDPLIVAGPLLAPFHIHPLITEYMYYNPVFHPIMKWIGALPVPNFAVGVNPLKIDRLEKTIRKVEQGLNAGESFLLYPAGMTKSGPREIIGGAFAAYDLLVKHPNTPVVLVRTTGLWGSRFSRAHSLGNQVDMGKALKHAFGMLLKSCIFFLPRRSVTVEFELATVSPEHAEKSVFPSIVLPLSQGRMEFNRALEKWYNKPFEEKSGLKAGEPLLLVRESCWSEELPTIDFQEEVKNIEHSIPSDIQTRVIEKIAELAGKQASAIQIQDHLVADVGLDSLNIAELIAFIEVHYDRRGINPQEMSTVVKACQYAAGQLSFDKEQLDPEIDTSLWEKPQEVKRLYIPEAETIVDAFFSTAWSGKSNRGVAGDTKAGIITYKKMRKAVFLLAREIARYEGDTVGVLLPASVMANLLIMAIQLAGKTPVMINWTVGGSHLEAVVEHAQLKTVLTSWSFLDRLENVDLSPIKDQIVVLEEAKATFLWSNYIAALFSSALPWDWIKKYTSLFPMWKKLTADSTAVILFTSGTESMPKGVPLTHSNILSNLRGALHSIELFSSDRILSMLPPFHSFGFAVTGIMPLLAGLRVYYSPNPLDAARLAHSIRYWKMTLLCSAPSFLKNILRQATQDRIFETVRLVVSGAEKAPEDIYTLIMQATPHGSFVEGYGITECSPVLTINTKGKGYGVGLPIPNVRLKIVDPEDYATAKQQGESGMILASGPNIFHGYLQKKLKNPFWIDGPFRWYVTGDIGMLDQKGNLHITGRLKRFVKIGGEMISLGAVEEALEKAFSSCIPDWNLERDERLKKSGHATSKGLQNIATSSFAVIPKGEEEGRPKLFLFSLFPVTQVEVNMALRKGGFSNLVKIDAVHFVDEFPLMGTGKVAYRTLEAKLSGNAQ